MQALTRKWRYHPSHVTTQDKCADVAGAAAARVNLVFYVRVLADTPEGTGLNHCERRGPAACERAHNRVKLRVGYNSIVEYLGGVARACKLSARRWRWLVSCMHMDFL